MRPNLRTYPLQFSERSPIHRRARRAQAKLARREEALAAPEEAVQRLTPGFLVRPLAYDEQMQVVTYAYVAACAALDREPSPELLGPIVEAVEWTQARAERK